MKNKILPLITVIVPVYNGDRWVARCLNSLVFQTLENIEIIAVDNGSTDKTWDILCRFAQAYPEKIIVRTIKHTNGPGSGRNVGLSLARAKYIAFSDADDYFEYDAMEQFYNKMREGDYDIVCCANYDVRGDKIKKARELAKTDKHYVERSGSMVFWNKLVKKELFDKAGKIPEDIVFEDIAYVSTLISLANKIGYVSKPLYYYIIRDDSGVNDLKSDRIMHELRADDIALKNCDASVKDDLIASVLYRVYYDMTKARWTYADKFIEYLKTNRELFNIEKVEKEKKLTDILERIDGIQDETIPEIVYYNDFEPASEEYLANVREVFREPVKLEPINSVTCFVYGNDMTRILFEEGNFKDLSAYFALKKIYETGGFYISPDVEMINTCDSLKYCSSVWGYEDSSNFTDEIFGSKPGTEIVGEILQKIQKNEGFSVKDCIKYTFMVTMKYRLDGETLITDDKTTLLDPTVLVTDISGDFNISRLKCGDSRKEYVTIKRSTWESINQ